MQLVVCELDAGFAIAHHRDTLRGRRGGVRKVNDVLARVADVDMLHRSDVVLKLLQVGEVLEKLLADLVVVDEGLLIGDSEGVELLGFF